MTLERLTYKQYINIYIYIREYYKSLRIYHFEELLMNTTEKFD